MNDEDRKPFWQDAKKTGFTKWHEFGDCPENGPHKCHRARGHKGPCACEHHNVWNWPENVKENKAR